MARDSLSTRSFAYRMACIEHLHATSQLNCSVPLFRYARVYTYLYYISNGVQHSRAHHNHIQLSTHLKLVASCGAVAVLPRMAAVRYPIVFAHKPKNTNTISLCDAISRVSCKFLLHMHTTFDFYRVGYLFQTLKIRVFSVTQNAHTIYVENRQVQVREWMNRKRLDGTHTHTQTLKHVHCWSDTRTKAACRGCVVTSSVCLAACCGCCCWWGG